MAIHPQKSAWLYFLFIAYIFFASCKKYEEEVIPGNTAPPDYTISNVTYENYVNKVYISVLGRKPDSTEFEQGVILLKSNKLALADRQVFLDTVMNKPGYYYHEFRIALDELLNGNDTADFRFWQLLIEDELTKPHTQEEIDQFNFELNRVNKVLEIPLKIDSGTIDIIEIHKRCINNLIYDMINMGTENFVVSVFNNFLSRDPTGYPTDSTLSGQENELNNASEMVDGFSSILFLKVGKSKDDFIQIFFDSPSYFEGQVTALYNRYLYRKPDTEEMYSETVKYQGDKDYRGLQKRILSLDEYVGLN